MAGVEMEARDAPAGHPSLEQRRARQDELWQDAKIDGRVHWSIRESYRLYFAQLQSALTEYKVVCELVEGLRQPECVLHLLSVGLLSVIVDTMSPGLGAVVPTIVAREGAKKIVASRKSSNFQICARKRPLLSFELEAREFDSVSAQGTCVVCHDGRLDRTGRRLSMTHREHTFDHVWDESTTDDEVFRKIQPLVQHARDGHGSTLLCYGQTGTGKTHTMMGALRRVVKELEGLSVEVVFFEIHGKKCYDLLSDRKTVHLRADENEKVHVRGAKQVRMECATSEGLLEIVQAALSLRSVKVTERNPISSRSHAVCRLQLFEAKTSVDAASTEAAFSLQYGGYMQLVDLAGSERNYETTKMSAQQHRESADINLSLMVLKDCFRAHSQLSSGSGLRRFEVDVSAIADLGTPLKPVILQTNSKRVPYRAHRLTQVLRDCFTDPQHFTLAVTTVSPSPTDLQHTVNSLAHVSLMAASLATLASEAVVDIPIHQAVIEVPIQRWTSEQVMLWVAAVDNGRFAHLALPQGLDGKGLLKLSAQRLSQLFEGETRVARNMEEGSAWTLEGNTRTVGMSELMDEETMQARRSAADNIGRALFAALRREMRRITEAEATRRMGGQAAATAAGKCVPSISGEATASSSIEPTDNLGNRNPVLSNVHHETGVAPSQAAIMQTVGGPQVVWWHDNESTEAAREAAEEATTLTEEL